MVIDDEPSIIASIERVLIAQHHVIGFTSARDALAALVLSKTTPDVILCDLMMPELSGPEFFTRLLAKNPSMAERVVFITGGAFGPSAQEFLDTVNPPLIEKPFRPDDLRKVVAERLKNNPRPAAKSSILSE
jgi:DNA-binding NtrC family response regulator